jgi:ABC-type nickel/cobalt efflux system permease component RcnA
MFELQRWLYATATSELRSLTADAGVFGLAHTIGIAAVFVFVHALMPGHGKTALVSYYLGRPARIVSGLGTSTLLILARMR